MSTRQQIRESTRILINETDSTNSRVSDDQLNGFINESTRFLATFLEHPRDFAEIQVEEGKGAYTLPTDNVLIRTAYFGNVSDSKDIRDLVVLSEETLKELFPSWLDESEDSKGTPKYLIQLDKRTVFLYPRPSADESVTGKKLHINYVFVPATMAADGDEPELPVPYHDTIQFYAAHLAYLKMENPSMSTVMLNAFNEKVKALKPMLTKETDQGFAFQWGHDDGVNIGTSEITFT